MQGPMNVKFNILLLSKLPLAAKEMANSHTKLR